MRGRKPLPAAVRRLNGNPSKRDILEPIKLDAEIPDPPRELAERSREHWDRNCRLLNEAKLLTKLDGDSLANYCDALARRESLNKAIERDGEIISGARGLLVLHPAFKALPEVEKAIRWFQIEYGLTASARMKVKPAGEEGAQEHPKNPFEEFMSGEETI